MNQRAACPPVTTTSHKAAAMPITAIPPRPSFSRKKGPACTPETITLYDVIAYPMSGVQPCGYSESPPKAL
jgi:hypothetical protein